MFIYKIYNLKTGGCYIGQTIQPPKNRFLRHKRELNNQQHPNIILQRAWNKYGESCFIFEVIKTCKSKNELDSEEFNLILKFGNYNIKKENTSSRSPCCPLNRSNRSRLPRSKETKDKISRAKKEFFANGGVGSMKNKKHSIESKQKMSDSTKEILRDYKNHPRYDTTLWIFINESTKEQYVSTKKEFIDYINPKTKNKIYQVCSGVKRSYKHWMATCII